MGCFSPSGKDLDQQQWVLLSHVSDCAQWQDPNLQAWAMPGASAAEQAYRDLSSPQGLGQWDRCFCFYVVYNVFRILNVVQGMVGHKIDTRIVIKKHEPQVLSSGVQLPSGGMLPLTTKRLLGLLTRSRICLYTKLLHIWCLYRKYCLVNHLSL